MQQNVNQILPVTAKMVVGVGDLSPWNDSECAVNSTNIPEEMRWEKKIAEGS